MNLNDNHPTFINFIKNEIKSLTFISNFPAIQSNFRSLADSCQKTFESYRGLKEPALKKAEFTFSSDFDISFEKKEQHIFIESKVEKDFQGIVSYVLSMCEKEKDGLKILRKFHFDYALPVKGDNSPKPIYHLQYGGKPSPALSAQSISLKELHPWLSSPRLNFTPTNLALLVDMAFCEFRTEVTKKIVEDKKWRDHIKHNESFLLTPYYNRVKDFLSAHHKSTCLVRDYTYGQNN